jgi:hypothetical protein
MFRAIMGLTSRHVCQNAVVPPPPCPHSQSVTMCLAYHVKGYCNVRCGRAADHVSYSARDNTALLAWCREHYVSAYEVGSALDIVAVLPSLHQRTYSAPKPFTTMCRSTTSSREPTT